MSNMRKKSIRPLGICLLGMVGFLAQMLFHLSFSWEVLHYMQFDKDISETYKIELKQMNPGDWRNDAPTILAPVLYKIIREFTTVSGDTGWEIESIDQVKIWTKNKTTAYFLGKNRSYIKLDLENKQEYIYEELCDYAPGDQKIFQKLEAHPELFLDEQEIVTVYQVRGRGEVPFRRLLWL